MEDEDKKKWFQDAKLWVEVLAIVASIIMSALALSKSYDSIEIARVSITPTLVAAYFISSSIDFLDERDSKKIERQKLSVEPPSDPLQIETNRQYAWLLIRNKGSGLAKIISMEITYSLGGAPVFRRLEWKEPEKDPRTISSGETLAVYLGYFLGSLQFTDKVKVAYRNALDETEPPKEFAPDGISLHMRNVAEVTITATPKI